MDNSRKKYIVFFALLLFLGGVSQSAFAIVENNDAQKTANKKPLFSFFKKTKTEKENKKKEKIKLTKEQKALDKIETIKLPPILSRKERPPLYSLKAMTMEDCVEYAINHNLNLEASKNRIIQAQAGIGEAKSNYAPRLTARISYNHNNNNGTRIVNSQENSLGFNVGISEMIWDFGRTTAKINLAKYDTQSAQFDFDYDILDVIYDVKINYYKVLSALANLDIYEQNVRIQSLNYDRTKAMFDEGLKSKIDVVNAQVNLADANIQFVEGQNQLQLAIIALKNSMYYQDDDDFIVQNTENFNFLKTDYKKKIENLNTSQSPYVPVKTEIKKTDDGLVMLTSGIEHRDIIQNFEFKPFVMTKKEAVAQALELRPDLKSHKMLALVQQESLKAIKKQYAPEITGDLTWGYTKSESTYSSPLQVGASVGLGSINPVGIHYQIKEGEAYLDIAYNNVNIATTDIFWEVQTNFVNMRQLEKKIPIINTKVKATLENFELADGRYSVGLNNYVELQDALGNYINSQLNYVEAVLEYNIARETLLKSMGVR